MQYRIDDKDGKIFKEKICYLLRMHRYVLPSAFNYFGECGGFSDTISWYARQYGDCKHCQEFGETIGYCMRYNNYVEPGSPGCPCFSYTRGGDTLRSPQCYVCPRSEQECPKMAVAHNCSDCRRVLAPLRSRIVGV